MHRDDRPRPTQLQPRPTDTRLRVGDAERTLVVDQLADHHAAGRLTLQEFEGRMASAWTARTGADLAVLTADLPSPAPSRSRPADRPAVSTSTPRSGPTWPSWSYCG